MSESEKAPITELLRQWSGGNRAALDQLLPLIHDDLRLLARRRLSSLPPGTTLQTCALVNELYLRLVDSGNVGFRDRSHFFAIAATLMRQVMIDDVRRRTRLKRGSDWRRIDLDSSNLACGSDESYLALDDALDRLAVNDQRKAKVVEMRFFAGMTNGEIGESLGISVDTVKRDWSFARLWLAREIKGTKACP